MPSYKVNANILFEAPDLETAHDVVLINVDGIQFISGEGNGVGVAIEIPENYRITLDPDQITDDPDRITGDPDDEPDFDDYSVVRPDGPETAFGGLIGQEPY
jgi:hypothetical protein